MFLYQLQQFRKKKESKGKSSNKTSKSDHEGDADLEPSPADPPASPKADEGEPTLPQGVNAESSESLLPCLIETSVATDVDSVHEPVPVQELELEPVALVKEGADAERIVEHEEIQGSSIGPSDESVVARDEFVTSAELASVDSSASHRDNRDAEKGFSLPQDLLSDVSSNKEMENQEADSLVSYQCDGRDKESHGSLQDGESLGSGCIRLEPEGVEESVVFGHRETVKDPSVESQDLEETEKVTGEGEFIEGDVVSVTSSYYKVKENYDEASISTIAEATDGAEEIPYMKLDVGTEGKNLRTEGTNEINNGTLCSNENHNVVIPVSAEAISREVGIVSMVTDERTEETTHRPEETDGGTENAGNGSDLATTPRELEPTPETDGEEKLEMLLVESLKQKLYTTNVAKDLFHMQLAEQIELQKDFDQANNQLLNEVAKLTSVLRETQNCNTSLSEELAQCRSDIQAMASGREELEIQFVGARRDLAQCRSDLQAMTVGKEELETQFAAAGKDLTQCRSDLHTMAAEREELETQFASTRKEIDESTARAFEFKTQLERSHEDTANLLAELAGFRSSMEALESENAKLHANLTGDIDRRNKLEDENKCLLLENERLGAVLLENQEQFSREQDKHTQVEVNLKEAMLRLEQLTQENIFLSSSVDIHKEKLKEIESQHSQLLSEATETRYKLEDVNIPTDDEHSNQNSEQLVRNDMFDAGESATLGYTEGKELQPLEGQNSGDSNGLSNFKTHLDEAQKTMQKLEKVIEGMHSHSVSLSRSGGKVAGAGVSKLIQAFELKVLPDENGPVELPLDEGERSTDDHLMLAKEQTNNLRAVLMELDLSAVKLNDEYNDAKSSKECGSAAFSELQILYEASKQQNNNLEARTVELVKKLADYQSRTDAMQLQLYSMEQKSCEMESLVFSQVEDMKKDLGDKLSVLEQEWNFTIEEISRTVVKLDASIGRLPTPTTSGVQSDALNFGCQIAASVNAATNVIENLNEKVGEAYTSLMNVHSSYESLNENFFELHVTNGLAVQMLDLIYSELKKFTVSSCDDVQGSWMDVKDENRLDILQPSNYLCLLNQLSELLDERLLLKSAKVKLESELNNRAQEVAELKIYCVGSETVLKLVEDVKSVVKLNDLEFDYEKPSASHLEALIAFLVQKCREASEQAVSCREEFEVKSLEYSELQVKMHQLSSLSSQQEDENQILKKSLSEMEGNLEALRSDLQAKGAELEQAEQRVSSVREKLSIAVAKGKGLIVQRDSLKQSISEISSELERCSQEVQLKDTRLREVETKLKAYSEAGERIEALESELSYIRNSATGLRESFLLKDSILQRIEEVLEDLELPKKFHSGDIIEKIEWLARSVSRNSLQMTEWDQKSSVGGSYSDAAFGVRDGWQEETQPIHNPGLNELQRKNEELQTKFYGLAEHNEMLEQSLVERNNLVRRWEEVLNKIEMPLQFRSIDTEERIEWLGSALSEANRDRDFLLKKIEDLKSHCGSLEVDLEQSQRKIYDLEGALQGVTRERELLSESFENLSSDQEKVLEKVNQYELEKNNLQSDVARLQEKLVKLENEDRYHHVQGEIKKLLVMVSDALPDQCAEDIAHSGSGTECLEELLKKLIEDYMALSFEKTVVKDIEEHHSGDSDVVPDIQQKNAQLETMEKDRAALKEELEEALSNLAHEKAEREKSVEHYKSLALHNEALGRQRDELQEKLNQEEMKLVSTRDKLNIAVRKGKGLVQQRDSLKQTIEDMKTEMDHLKSELSQREIALGQYEQKIRGLSIYQEKVETLERECLFLRSHLTEMEHRVQDSGNTLSGLINSLNAIDVGSGLNTIDPVEKMEMIGRLWHDLQAALTSSEHESKKSKRATELLLAELNEVHERADSLQEELSKVEAAVAEISKERDLAEAARTEAFSRLENVTTDRSDKRRKELVEVMKLKAVSDQLRKGCFSFTNLLADVFSADLELLSNVEDGMESLFERSDVTNVFKQPLLAASDAVLSANPAYEVAFPAIDASLDMKMQENFDDSTIDVFHIVCHALEECTKEIDTLREKCYKHSVSCDHQAKKLSKAMENVHKELASQKESLESTKRDFTFLESMRKEKDTEILLMHRKIALLYKACMRSILEINNQKAQLVRDGVLVDGKKDMNKLLPAMVEGQESIDEQTCFSEESIISAADTLLSAVKDLTNIQAGMVTNGQKELKVTISNMQKELQEKDIQKNRICAELVSQIKKAEADAKNYLVDLQSSKAQVGNLEKHIEALEQERNVLDLKIKELQIGETSSIQLQEKIISLNDLLSVKGQEIEDLMQALDEEELQMESLRNKVEELERFLQEKNLVVENLEASRAKTMAKLSTTVSKFDELHQLSEGLLSEIENLQAQLQGRDAEISFLRQEVTRCTNDVLAASHEGNKRNVTEMHNTLTWLDMMISRFGGCDVQLDNKGCSRLEACKEILEKQLTSLFSELEALRVMAQHHDALLQVEKNKTEELVHKSDSLERFLHEKELIIESLQGSRDLAETTSIAPSEITEIEPMINKRAVAGATPQVRSLRKVNNDQVAISIDMDSGGSTLDDEDDKMHGFKALTTSRIVPRFTRPVSNMIDGLWVSCDRALMRQPALRLVIILYWFMLHTLLATSMV
ncbi:nucleoporin [Thalictrum thalictroides]|uniref:Nucleoporin n=1 Tax=Thalictrum thalictroides TaxID=46969 RepID=A0A7J6W1B7_THATH|nr:nucleoporin [Thalictrum thalictroides]